MLSIPRAIRRWVRTGVWVIGTMARAAGLRPAPVSVESCRRLILFTRYPRPGEAKTRLIPALGQRDAADLQRRMTERLIRRAGALARRSPLSVEVCFDGARAAHVRQWLGRWPRYRPQGGGDLGERMARAFRCAFRDGMRRVVLVGSDCPGVTSDLLGQAFRELGRADVVLGPAADGGYYLMGLRQPAPELFRDIAWGTDAVFAQTVNRAREAGLRVGQVAQLQDVDVPADLERISGERGLLPSRPARPKVSVIIPTLNEESYVGAACRRALTGRNVEVVVADGGSTDDTVEEARAAGARIVQTGPGRARQLNSAASSAEGELLLFVHADTLLPLGFSERVRKALGERGVVAGTFDLAIGGSGIGLRLVESVVALRSRWGQLPYGDQGLFLTRRLFERMGGFAEMPIMEDYEFVRRLERRGRIRTVPVPVLTSPRRWQRLGVLKTTIVNSAVVAAYHLGVDPDRLARWYRGGDLWGRPEKPD